MRDCGIPRCSQIFHSCGKLLIEICRYTTFHHIVVHKGLIRHLLSALEVLKEQDKPSEVSEAIFVVYLSIM